MQFLGFLCRGGGQHESFVRVAERLLLDGQVGGPLFPSQFQHGFESILLATLRGVFFDRPGAG